MSIYICCLFGGDELKVGLDCIAEQRYISGNRWRKSHKMQKCIVDMGISYGWKWMMWQEQKWCIGKPSNWINTTRITLPSMLFSYGTLVHNNQVKMIYFGIYIYIWMDGLVCLYLWLYGLSLWCDIFGYVWDVMLQASSCHSIHGMAHTRYKINWINKIRQDPFCRFYFRKRFGLKFFFFFWYYY